MKKPPKRRAGKQRHAAPRRDPSPTADSKILWPHQLARRWSVHFTTIWKARVDGKIPAYDFKLGGRFGWRLETIEAFERQRPGAQQTTAPQRAAAAAP